MWPPHPFHGLPLSYPSVLPLLLTYCGYSEQSTEIKKAAGAIRRLVKNALA
jgi:hypothetical protein